MIDRLTDEELLDLVDDNLADLRRSIGARPGAGGSAAFGALTRDDRDEELAQTLAIAGFRATVAVPVMVVDAVPVRASEPGDPGDILVRPVAIEDAADRAALVDIVRRADPGPGGSGWLGLALDGAVLADVLDRPEIGGFIAIDRSGPAAAVLVHRRGPVLRIVWVGTLPEARRRGYGSAVVRAAIAAGVAGGARVTVVDSSGDAESFYRTLGFRTLTGYRIWTFG